MGIPSFFRHIVSRYKDTLIKDKNVKNKKDPTYLFIDLNCILHKIAAEMGSKFPTASLISLEDIIIKESIIYVQKIRDYIISSFPDLQLFYISVDGICPRAKMTQQRKRRFVSSWRNRLTEEYAENKNKNWNSNVITPGTTFMKKFDDELNKTFSYDPKTIVSSSAEEGEGEHKIYHYMNKYLYEREKNIIIYGLDADLILLSLLHAHHNNKNIYLMRENEEFNINLEQKKIEPFLFLDIYMLKKYILQYYFQNINNTHENKDENDKNDKNDEKYIRDYVILCTLLGNDFLPPLSFIKVKNNGIDFIIDIYKNCLLPDKNEYLIDEYGIINELFLQRILRYMSKHEDKNMQEIHEKYIDQKPFFIDFKKANTYTKIMHEIDNYPSHNKISSDIIDPTKKHWRQQYYQSLFHGDLVSDICRNYIEGLQWVIEYYIKQNTIWDWYYKYSYSPLILELANYIEFEIPYLHKGNINTIFENMKKSVLSNEQFLTLMKENNLQLYLVLPPCSAYLLNDPKGSRLMTELKYGCLHYYPREFKISTFLKYFIWECSAVLPDINILYLYKQLQNAKK